MYPSILYILLILITGYIFVTNVSRLRYTFKRSENWAVYLLVATHGLWIFLLAWGIVSLFNIYGWFGLLSNWLGITNAHLIKLIIPLEKNGTDLTDKLNEIKIIIRMSFIFLVSIGLAYIFGFIDKIRLKITNSATKNSYEIINNNPFEQILMRASGMIGLTNPLLFTLDSNKIYIGWVRKPALEHGKVEYISIIPLLSGYRDKDTQEIVLVNNYASAYNENNDLSLEHFIVVIPTSEIVSISIFDHTIHKKVSSPSQLPNYK